MRIARLSIGRLPWTSRGYSRSSSGADVPRPKYKQSIGDVALRASKEEDQVYNSGDAKFWAEICAELYYHLNYQSPRNISLVLSSLARKQVKDAQLMDYVASRLNPAWLTVFNIQDLALLCNSYASFSHPAPQLFQDCAEELLWKLPDATSQELAVVASAYSKLRAYDATLYRHIAAQSLLLQDITPRHAANLLHAFARVSAPEPPKFLDGLAERVILGVAELNVVGVVHGALAAGQAARHKESAQNLLEALTRRFVTLLRHDRQAVSAHHVAIMGRAFVQAGLRSERVVECLAEVLFVNHCEPSVAASHDRPKLQQLAEASRALLATHSASKDTQLKLEQSWRFAIEQLEK